MKTIKFLFTATVVAIAAIATAVEKPKMNVVPLTSDRAILSVTNEKAAFFELSILAKNGDVVYFKQSTKPLTSYQQIFDFENLENGSYVFNLRVNDTELSRNVEVATKGIYVGESKLRFDPYFAFDGKILKLSYLNFDQEKFTFNLYNHEGLIFQSRLGNDFTLSSGYDLSNLEKGKYKIVLSSFKNEFVYNLER